MSDEIFQSLSDCRFSLLKKILLEGEYSPPIPGHCEATRYILGETRRIRYVEDLVLGDPFGGSRKVGAQKMEEYIKEVIPSTDSMGFDYTYGQRLGEQIEVMNKKLRREHCLNDRQIQAITWDRKTDPERENPPCLQRIWVYPYYDSILHKRMVIIEIEYRSWDTYGAYAANMQAFRKLAEEYILKDTGFEIKCWITHGSNMHIYAGNIPEAVASLNARYPGWTGGQPIRVC